MGCYLGDSIFRTSYCSAVIVSDGKPNIEKLAWAQVNTLNAQILVTGGCNERIYCESFQLDYWDGAKWVKLTGAGAFGAYGYVEWSVGITTLGMSWWFRMRAGSCVKIFKVGDPGSAPCEFRQNLQVRSVDDATSLPIVGSTWNMTFVSDPGRKISVTTGSAGTAIISSLCRGIYDIVVSATGYAPATSKIEVTATENLITRLKKITPLDNASFQYVNDSVAAEAAQRQYADSAEATARQNADAQEATARQNADAQETSERQKADNTLSAGITALQGAVIIVQNSIIGAVIDAFQYIIEKVLEQEVKR